MNRNNPSRLFGLDPPASLLVQDDLDAICADRIASVAYGRIGPIAFDEPAIAARYQIGLPIGVRWGACVVRRHRAGKGVRGAEDRLICTALPDWRNCEPITATRAQWSWSELPT